jgi:hypothetical protein
VPVADIYEIFTTAAPRRLGKSACSKLPLWIAETVNFTAECACFFVALQNFNEAQQQDQSGILAQIFLSCGNLLAGIFPRSSIHRSITFFCQVPLK